MKTAIMAVAKGYSVQQISTWMDSLKATGYSGKTFIILYDQDTTLAQHLRDENFHVFFGVDEKVTHIATKRFRDYVEVLQSPYAEDVDLVIHTDIRDVYFQENPDIWLRENIGDHQIVATAEGVSYRHEDWNGDGMQNQFGKQMFDELVDCETLCSGIIAGKKDAVIDLFTTIYDIAKYSKEPHGFVDQHFYNIAIRKIYSKITKIAPADGDWVLNCGTMIALPTLNPQWSTSARTPWNSYERFRKGSYLENMIAKLPIEKDGKICNSEGTPYTIVHQYDRYEPWKKLIQGETIPVTLVTALYDLKRETWKGFERSFEQYKDYARRLFGTSSPMVIFVEEKDRPFVEEMRIGKEEITKIVVLPFKDFVTEKFYGLQIRNLMKTSEFLKDQTVPNHPQISRPEYNILMHEKIQFVKKAIEENPFGTEHFMWIDAGIIHMNQHVNLQDRIVPEQTKVLQDKKLHLIAIEKPEIPDNDYEKFFKGHNVQVIGTSWVGHKDAILEFEKTYTSFLQECISKNLMDQDQSFLTACHLRRPDISNVWMGNWQSSLNMWL